jgi:hypothetical protein
MPLPGIEPCFISSPAYNLREKFMRVSGPNEISSRYGITMDCCELSMDIKIARTSASLNNI